MSEDDHDVVGVDSVKRGLLRHERLPDNLMVRVRLMHYALAGPPPLLPARWCGVFGRAGKVIQGGAGESTQLL